MGRIAVVILWLLVVATLLGGSQQTAHYRSCSLGKGKAKLYNCDSKYDTNGTKIVRISDIDTAYRYVIKLRENETAKAVDEICEQAEAYRYRTYSGYCIHKYKKVWIGMLMMIDGGNLSQLLTREAGSIDHVEVDGTLRVCSGVVQGNPPNWGIDRIDHLPGQLFLNELYTTNSTGDGVHVYVLDTGIRCSHSEFHYQDGRLNTTTGLPLSRCSNGFDAVKDGHGTNDCNGHGTHCAGIVGGLTTGVAKDVTLHPVRVMDCNGLGTYGAVLASLDWISHNLIRPAVISMSLATTASISIDQAITNLINTNGVVGVAAAGNFLQATCNYSPARAPSVIAVASSNAINQMSFFSNYGNCTTMFAPGELIYSSYNASDSSYAVLSGTSMACPHVAGTAALYLSQNVDARPADVRQALLDVTEPNGVLNMKLGTTTKLVNTNLKQPFFNIHPRSFYNVPEYTTQQVVVSLVTKPSQPVTLTPKIDANIGYFIPAQLTFGTNANWSLPQTLSLALLHNQDFLDHSSTILWVFNSQDTQYVSSPEGLVTARDTGISRNDKDCSRLLEKADGPGRICLITISLADADICRTCGQTADDPKIIPSLPFYYLEDTTNYQNNFTTVKSNPHCHGSGPDVVFQYTATADMVVNISLCGINTQFDTILTLYEKINTTNKNYSLRLLGCNDDFCGLQSFLKNVALQSGHTYVLVVDGYYGSYGLADIYIYPSGAPSSPIRQQLETTFPVVQSVITSSFEVESAICTLWDGETCEAPPTPTPIRAGFFWSPVAWGLCDKECGGGSQQAVMKCFTGNYTEVTSSSCAAVPQPVQTQVCNAVACENYTLVEGPWGECNQTCGTGTQKRQVTCMDSLGNTANPSKCGGENHFQKERLCNTNACNGTHWEAGLWNYCNLPCGKGQKFRNPVCFSNGTIVGDNNCSHLEPPVARMDCNTHPCQTFAWLVGRWDNCPSGCNATKNRLVQCVDGLGQNVGDALCNSNNKPSATIPCQQPGVTCNYCQQNNCSNNGICKGTECSCFKGWEGLYCEWSTMCYGRPTGYLKNGTMGCCPYSKIDNNQRCCGTAGAVIDINGVCCDGTLDACGMCNGPHRSIDSQNQCCPTLRDEKGVCCASGVLDECYVCDGDGTTCASNVTITTVLDDSVKAASNSSANWKAFLIQFMAKVTNELHVATDALLLTGVQTTNSEIESCNDISEITEGCRQSVTTQFLGVFNFTVLPIPLKDLTTMKIEVGDIRKQLSPTDDDPTTEFIPGVKMQSVSHVKRAGICGNGVCERGERCDQSGKGQTSSGSCCLKDCPYVPKGCPAPVAGPRANLSCSKNGLCLDARGHCACFRGYQGASCQQCQNGWTEMQDGTCMKMVDPLRTQGIDVNFSNINVTIPPGPWNDNITITKGTAAAGILGTVITIGFLIGLFCCIKHCCCTEKRRNALPTTPATLPRNIEMEEQNKLAQEARRKSLAEERIEAVQDRRKSRIYENSAVRKSLLMEPVVVKEAPAATLAPAPIQSEPPNVISKLRKSILGDSAVVINGKRKSLAGDQDYSKLEPSQLKVTDTRYQNAPISPHARYEDQQMFQNVPLAPQRYEGQVYQNVSPPSAPIYLPRYEGQRQQYTNIAPQPSQYSAQYDGQRYQNAPQPIQSASTYPPRFEGQEYQNVPQPSQQSAQLYSPRYEQQQYQNAAQIGPYPQYEGQQYYPNAHPPRYTSPPRYEAQPYQNAQPYPQFQPTQHFQIIPIQSNEVGASTPQSAIYGDAPSPTNTNLMAVDSPSAATNSIRGSSQLPLRAKPPVTDPSPEENPNPMSGSSKPPAANPSSPPPGNPNSMGSGSKPPSASAPPSTNPKSLGGGSSKAAVANPPPPAANPDYMGSKPPVTNPTPMPNPTSISAGPSPTVHHSYLPSPNDDCIL